MQARVLTTFPAVEAIQTRWSALFDRCKGMSTFCSYEWLVNWYCTYQPPVNLQVIVVEHDAQIVGIAPLVTGIAERYGIKTPALFMLGDGVESDHTGFLVDPDYRDQVMRLLLEQIDRLPWKVAHLNQIPEYSETAEALLNYAQRHEWCTQIEYSPCPYRLVPSSYKELLDSMQRRFRSTLRSTRRRLEEKHQVQFGLHDSEHEFPEALDTLFRNHKSRWAAKEQMGVFEDERRRSFYRRLTPALYRRGWLRFFYLKLDDAIIAHEYCFERDGNVYLLQEGFDYSFAEANVGHALRSYVMEWLIVNKKRCYDFLAGTSRHKQHWSSAINNDLRITIARGKIAPLLHVKVPIVMASAKNALKRMLVALHLWSAIEPVRGNIE